LTFCGKGLILGFPGVLNYRNFNQLWGPKFGKGNYFPKNWFGGPVLIRGYFSWIKKPGFGFNWQVNWFSIGSNLIGLGKGLVIPPGHFQKGGPRMKRRPKGKVIFITCRCSMPLVLNMVCVLMACLQCANLDVSLSEIFLPSQLASHTASHSPVRPSVVVRRRRPSVRPSVVRPSSLLAPI